MKYLLILFACLAMAIDAQAQSAPDLFTPNVSFRKESKIISTTFFVWWGEPAHRDGPWTPLEGNAFWDGSVSFFEAQIKHTMRAGIDELRVHYVDDFHAQRLNFFAAHRNLRARGYDVPTLTPFVDFEIIYNENHGRPQIDLSTRAGKDEFTSHYHNFYSQYFEVNQGVPNASDYLTQIDGRPVLSTWNTRERHLANKGGLKRKNVTNRLNLAMQGQTDLFENPVYMITGRQSRTFDFVDEKVEMYQTLLRYAETEFDGIVSAQLKPGYWDANVRLQGNHIPRRGGVAYANAAAQVDPARVSRVYIESWNEHSEGTGIFPAQEFITRRLENSGTDDWSLSDDPLEYVRTTFQLARGFNGIRTRDASILWHNIPEVLTAGETSRVSVVIRNEGNNLWSERKAYRLGERNGAGIFFTHGQRVLIDDLSDDVSLYGGHFRGQPVTFSFDITAPDSPGDYSTRYRMLQEEQVWFGETLQLDIKVIPASQSNGFRALSEPITGDFDADGDADGDDVDFYFGNLARLATGELAQLDLDGDGIVTLMDHNLFVTTLAVTSNGVTGALLGDVNLDGTVDVLSDAFALVGNLGQSSTSRSQGDLNADRVVDVLNDAFILVGQLGQSNDP